MIRPMFLAGVMLFGALGQASAQYLYPPHGYPAPGPAYVYPHEDDIEYRRVYRRPVIVAPPPYYAAPRAYYYGRPVYPHPGYYWNYHRFERDRQIYHSR